MPAVGKFEIPLKAPIAPFDDVSGAIGEMAGKTNDQAHDTSWRKFPALAQGNRKLKFRIGAAVPPHRTRGSRFL
jgi:hypothetical protein